MPSESGANELAEITPSKKKLVQARLPFKVLTEPSSPATPVIQETRKRKLSSQSSEVLTKIGKVCKENESAVPEAPIVIDEDSKDAEAETGDKQDKTINPYVKLVEIKLKKKLRKGKPQKREVKTASETASLKTNNEKGKDETIPVISSISSSIIKDGEPMVISDESDVENCKDVKVVEKAKELGTPAVKKRARKRAEPNLTTTPKSIQKRNSRNNPLNKSLNKSTESEINNDHCEKCDSSDSNKKISVKLNDISQLNSDVPQQTNENSLTQGGCSNTEDLSENQIKNNENLKDSVTIDLEDVQTEIATNDAPLQNNTENPCTPMNKKRQSGRVQSNTEKDVEAEMPAKEDSHLNNTESPSTPANNNRQSARVKSNTAKELNECANQEGTPKSSGKKCDTKSPAQLTPKQLARKLEWAKKAQEKEQERLEREKKRQEEKEERARVRKEQEEQKKKEREEKEEQRRKEREEKEEQKRKEKEEKEEQRRKEKEEKEKQKELEKKEREAKEEERRKEKEVKEEEKKKEREAKEEERKKKLEAMEEEKRLKEQEKQEQEFKRKKAAEAFVNFFVPKQKVDMELPEQSQTNMLSSFAIKSDMRLAPQVRHRIKQEQKSSLEDSISSQEAPTDNLYLQILRSKNYQPRWASKTWPLDEKDEDCVIVENEDDLPPVDDMGQAITFESTNRLKLRPKLFSFTDNRRPPYWGTWRKHSNVVKPRRPFATDTTHLDYEVDSDLEWEDEGEGESIEGSAAGSDDEHHENDDYEVDNEFFVPHGYLSDEEGTMDTDNVMSLSPETQKAKLKHLELEFESEHKKPTEKLKPRIYGPIWADQNGGRPENCIESLWNYFEKLAMIYDDTESLLKPPPEPEKPEVKEKKKKKPKETPEGEVKEEKPKKQRKEKQEVKKIEDKKTPNPKQKNQLQIMNFLKPKS